MPGQPGDPAEDLERREVEVGALARPGLDQLVDLVPHARASRSHRSRILTSRDRASEYLDVKIVGGHEHPGTPTATWPTPTSAAGRSSTCSRGSAPTDPAAVVDLGCGPGNLTALLAERWPGAECRASTPAPEMIAAARRDRRRRRRLRGRRPARLAARATTRSTSSSQRDAAVGARPPRPAAAAGRRGRARAAGSPSRCPATSTSRATRSAPSWPPSRAYAAAHGGRRRPALARPGRLPRAAAGARLRGRRLGDDLPARARRARTPFQWVTGTGARPTLQALPDDLRAAFVDEFQARLARGLPGAAATARRRAARSAGSSWSRRRRPSGQREAAPRAGRLPARRRGRRPRRFYGDGLGLREVDKPAGLAARGGAWFRAARRRRGAELHVGVEDDFRPARKAHPALLLDDLDARRSGARLRRWGSRSTAREEHKFPGHRRFHTFDAHGNRVEVLRAIEGT